MSFGTQSSLSESLRSATKKGYLDTSNLSALSAQFESLSLPTPDEPKFSAHDWLDFINACSGAESLRLRQSYSKNSPEYKVLTAISIHHRDTTENVSEAFSITTDTDDEKLISNVYKFVVHVMRRYPLATLLSSWLQDFYIHDREDQRTLLDRDRGTAGYYHPTEHLISICSERGRPDTGWWGITNEGVSETVERSTTIHELGHAIHYLFGLQTTDPQIDNSDKSVSEAQISIRDSVTVTTQRSEFIFSCIKGYGLLLSGEYSSLDWQKNSRTNVEEFVAEGFNAYITSPRYLAQEQYALYKLFSSFDEYYC